MKRTIEWVGKHPWAGTAFLLGVVTGMLICLPLFPIEIPDGISQLMGSALGAGIAVFGAAWVAGSTQRGHRKQLMDVARLAVSPLLRSLDDFNEEYAEGRDPHDSCPHPVLVSIEHTRGVAEGVATSLDAMAPTFSTDSIALYLHHRLLQTVKRVVSTCEDAMARDAIREKMSTDPTRDIEFTLVVRKLRVEAASLRFLCHAG